MKTIISRMATAILLCCALDMYAQTAVTAWDRVGVMNAPAKTSSQIATLYFGTDVVNVTDETIQVQEDRKRTYVKVVLTDGATGWINQYLLISNGEGAVVKQTTGVFQNPVDGITMMRGLEFEAGEPVIKTEFNGAYAYVYSKERKKSGWIPVESLIFSEDELKMALALQKAKDEKNISKRLQKLEEIRSQANFSFSPLAYLVDKALVQSQELAANTITSEQETRDLAMASATPSNSKRGAPQAMTERVIKPGDKLEESILMNGQVFSKHQQQLSLIQVVNPQKTNSTALECYHKTLSVGSKLQMFLPDNPGFIEFEVIGNLTKNEGLGFTAGTIKRVFGETIPDAVTVQYFTKE